MLQHVGQHPAGKTTIYIRVQHGHRSEQHSYLPTHYVQGANLRASFVLLAWWTMCSHGAASGRMRSGLIVSSPAALSATAPRLPASRKGTASNSATGCGQYRTIRVTISPSPHHLDACRHITSTSTRNPLILRGRAALHAACCRYRCALRAGDLPIHLKNPS